MTLLETLSAQGRLEMKLVADDGDQAVVSIERGGVRQELVVEDVKFNTGGALTMVHNPRAAAPGEVTCEACQ